jgi:hypothetical protein
MPKTNSKLVNWFLGITGTLVSTLIIGSMTLLVKLDNRTAELVTILELTSEHLKEGIEQSVLNIGKNTSEIHEVKQRVVKLEIQNEQDEKYNKRLDSLHDTVKKIEGKMEVE